MRRTVLALSLLTATLVPAVPVQAAPSEGVLAREAGSANKPQASLHALCDEYDGYEDCEDDYDYTAPVVLGAAVEPDPVRLTFDGDNSATVQVQVQDDTGVGGVAVGIRRDGDYVITAALDYMDGEDGSVETWETDVDVPLDMSTGRWTLDVYAVDYDDNGDLSEDVTAFYIKRDTALTLNASPEPVRRGSTITTTGRLTRLDPSRGYVAYSGKTVKLYFKPAGGSYRYVGSATTDSYGKYRKTWDTSRGDGTWKAVFDGTSNYVKRSSGGDFVDVV